MRKNTKQNGRKRVARSLGLLLAALFFTTTAKAVTVDVTIQDDGGTHFSPLYVDIHVGDTVRWIWNDGFNHSATSGDGDRGQPDGIFESGIHRAPFTYSVTFQNVGTFPYYCDAHRRLNHSGVWPRIRVSAATGSGLLSNISTRAFVQTGDNVMIGGFIVQGTQSKRVIIRAIGPELTSYGVPNPLGDPTLELHDGTGALIASNDNWQTTIVGGIITSDQVGDISNSGHAPGDPRESAVIADLAAGNYTAVVRGLSSSTGVALVEVYDLRPDSGSILGNISTRSFVQTGDDVMIGGFIVQGTEPKSVIIRAIGPALSQYGVPDSLADPTLELHDGTGALIASNDNWQTTIIGGIITQNQVGDIQNSGHAPTEATESAIIATLPPGNYTAIVRGTNNAVGVALVEVYGLN